MKKFLKFLLGVAAVAGAVCGVLYFAKNVLGFGDDDFDDDFEDEDFDDFEDEADDREYVTLDLDEEKTEDTEENVSAEEETESEE